MKITINNYPEPYSGPLGFIAQMVVMALATVLAAYIMPGVHIDTFWAAILTAAVIALLNNFIRPILIVITLPVTAITLGLFLFVINAIIILMASELVGGFHVDSFGSALLFSLILMGVNYLLELPNKYLNSKPLQQQQMHQDNDTDDEGFTPYEEIKD